VRNDSRFVLRQKLLGEDRSLRLGDVMVSAARCVFAKFRGDVFARFHAVAAKLRNRTRNSQFGLLGPVPRATTTSSEYFGYYLVYVINSTTGMNALKR
jgi:hypothetical protein